MQIHLPETDFLENLGTGGPWTRGVSVARKALPGVDGQAWRFT